MVEQELQLEDGREASQGRKGVAWGLGAALIGSLCCIGPVAAVAMGLGSASFLFGFTAYRPYFLGASLLLMGAGAYFLFRRSRTCRTRQQQQRNLWMYLGTTVGTFALGYALLTYVLPGLMYNEVGASAAALSAAPQEGRSLSNPGGGPVSAQGVRQAVLEISGMT